MGFSDRTARGRAGTTEIGYTRLTGIAATASTIDSVYGEKNQREKEKKRKGSERKNKNGRPNGTATNHSEILICEPPEIPSRTTLFRRSLYTGGLALANGCLNESIRTTAAAVAIMRNFFRLNYPAHAVLVGSRARERERV